MGGSAISLAEHWSSIVVQASCRWWVVSTAHQRGREHIPVIAMSSLCWEMMIGIRIIGNRMNKHTYIMTNLAQQWQDLKTQSGTWHQWTVIHMIVTCWTNIPIVWVAAGAYPYCKNAMPCHLCVDNGWQSRHYMASMDSCCLRGWWYFIVWLPRLFWTNTGASRGSPGKLAICSLLSCNYSKYIYRWAKQISTMQTHWILSQKEITVRWKYNIACYEYH